MTDNFGAPFPATGTAAGAQYLDEAPTYAPGELVPLQTDAHGNLKVVASGNLSLSPGSEPWRVAWDGQSVEAIMSGPWNVGRSWALDREADSVSATQSGPWVVRANAGEGLNTSALALESGGNLAAVAAALGAVEDGIYGGSGAASVIGALKGVYKSLSGTISVAWGNQGVTLEAGSATIGAVDVNRPASLATGQVEVGANAVPIVASRKERMALRLRNVGTATVFIGAAADVTPETGWPLLAGEALPVDATAALYGVTEGEASPVAVIEEF